MSSEAKGWKRRLLDGRTLRRMWRAERGAVAIIWSLTGVGLMAMAGLAVDYGRALHAKSALQGAADAAALAAERIATRSLAERSKVASAMFRASLEDQSESSRAEITLTEIADGGHRVDAQWPISTSITKIFHQDDLIVRASADAVQESGPVEVALVLDNTGSMVNDMANLRTAAEDLVNTVYAAARKPGDVMISVVPFVAQVNIGDTPTSRAWIDQTGASPFNGEMLEDRLIARRVWVSADGASCQNLSTLPFSSYSGPYRVRWERGAGANSGFCYGYTPSSVNHLTLFGLIPNAVWRGCVEARPEPFDISDAAPTIANPATLFVPYFWADNADGQNNSYLTDTTGDITGATMTNSLTGTGATDQRRARAFNVFKYRGANGAIDNSAPDTQGPNRACPTPVAPLTTHKQTIIDAVRAMQHWNSSGTNQVEGLAWGWRVLSPDPPFTQGAPYGEKKKVIVLMTDGQNTNVGTGSSASVFGSDYAAYGFLSQWTASTASPPGLRATLPAGFARNAITSSSAYVSYINTRQGQLCEAIKAAGVEIFTIIYRETDATARMILQNCASPSAAGVKRYYVASSAAELRSAFDTIGAAIGQLRITR
jgi:Flp pilus assembly protein TadG